MIIKSCLKNSWHHSQFTVVVNSLHVKGENDPNARIRGVQRIIWHNDFDPKTMVNGNYLILK